MKGQAIGKNLEIINFIADGKKAGEIGKLLFLSQQAIETRICNMISYYNCSTRTHLCFKLLDLGIYVRENKKKIERPGAIYDNKKFNS